jgi:hypothetical protein
VLDELIRGGREQPYAMLLRFDFLGDADNHGDRILTELTELRNDQINEEEFRTEG